MTQTIKQIRKQEAENIRAFALGDKSSFDDENLTVRGVIISSSEIDSYNTRLIPGGVVLDRFGTNAPLLYNHLAEEEPIGRVENVRKDGEYLLADVVLTKIGGQGAKIYGWLKERTLSAFSVRFEPLERHWEDKEGNRLAEDEIDIWRDVEVYDQWRLLEVSVVTIPANPSAVVVRSQKAMLTREEIREIVKSELDQRKKERQEKREQAEEQKQAVETDARAALSSAYQAIGKQLSCLNKK